MTKVKTYRLGQLKEQVTADNPVEARHNFGGDKWNTHELTRSFDFLIDSRRLIQFKEGFTWDGSSVPSLFWFLLKPFGAFDIAYIVHDALYKNKGKMDGFTLSRKQSDDLMLSIAKEMMDTKKISLRKCDFLIRYAVVLVVGWYKWYDVPEKIKAALDGLKLKIGL